MRFGIEAKGAGVLESDLPEQSGASGVQIQVIFCQGCAARLAETLGGTDTDPSSQEVVSAWKPAQHFSMCSGAPRVDPGTPATGGFLHPRLCSLMRVVASDVLQILQAVHNALVSLLRLQDGADLLELDQARTSLGSGGHGC